MSRREPAGPKQPDILPVPQDVWGDRKRGCRVADPLSLLGHVLPFTSGRPEVLAWHTARSSRIRKAHPPHVNRCQIPIPGRLLRRPHRSRCGRFSPPPSRRPFPRLVGGRGISKGHIDGVGSPSQTGSALGANGIDRAGSSAPTMDRELTRVLRGEPSHSNVHRGSGRLRECWSAGRRTTSRRAESGGTTRGRCRPHGICARGTGIRQCRHSISPCRRTPIGTTCADCLTCPGCRYICTGPNTIGSQQDPSRQSEGFATRLQAAQRSSMTLTVPPVLTFTRSHDLFGDGSVVLVDLAGHTPGSVGVLLHTSGGYVLLAGDAAWHTYQIESIRQKSSYPGGLADEDRAETFRTLHRRHAIKDQLGVTPTNGH